LLVRRFMTNYQELSISSDETSFASAEYITAVSCRNEPAPNSHTWAIELDACATEQVSLGALWARLAAGAWQISDRFTTDSRLYFVLESRHAVLRKPDVALLTRTMLGERPKVLAYDLHTSRSTLCQRLRSTLLGLGIETQPSRVPVLLIAAAAVGAGLVSLPPARLTRVATPGREILVVSAARFDAELQAALSPSEQVVARHMVDDLTQEEIARRRRRSLRTIANQAGSIFRKLRLSGRAELKLHVVLSNAQAPGPASSSAA